MILLKIESVPTLEKGEINHVQTVDTFMHRTVVRTVGPKLDCSTVHNKL